MKASIIGLFILFFFLGYVLNTPTDNQLRVDPEKLEEFENEIILEDNEYSNYSNVIESGKVNDVGKLGERIIDKGFDLIFDVIKKVIKD